MAKELDAATKAHLTRLVNKVVAWQIAEDRMKARIKDAKATIKQIAKSNRGLERHETGQGVAVVTWPEKRTFDVEVIEKIVDAEDLEVIAPRKVVAAKLDEVIGHHKYADLDQAVTVSKAKTPTVEVRVIEG